jgi:antitoxin MazE
MKAELIRIGNSQGIRIPRAVIDQRGFGRRVEMRVEGENLIITRKKAVRSGWDEAFKAMAEQGDDATLFPTTRRTALIGPSGSGELAETIRGLAGLARTDEGLGDPQDAPLCGGIAR